MFKKIHSTVCLVSLLVALSGCRAGRVSAPPAAATDPDKPSRIAGKILSVNTEFGYVVLRCMLPPGRDTQATVYRGNLKTGELLFTDKPGYPYVNADILDGEPRQGDLVVY